MSNSLDTHALQYVMLEIEAEKRKQRRLIEELMVAYLAKGGLVRQVNMVGEPKPRFKYLNRQQKAKAKGLDDAEEID